MLIFSLLKDKKKGRELTIITMHFFFLPEVIAFGDGISFKGSVQSCERVQGYTVLNVKIQVTIPLNVYSYFSTLNKQDDTCS